ncbi:DapH/DapD/GlmU-related protein [Lachnotalea glycerini]|jgi:UDP-3-O-[3-hydroxymyristoyl] glucosamine N-acyltransferase LpxD|uniref:UDP-3-O-[3-hydroxymyristoyl] glucosamine N-acyltransferase n=1 Tax=Lachnotalea glycerini TaxID=1763509 RepID=A0A371JG36_9FIRM|nr:DapH/DapD/GlmU-related protein [Lachnotalea glycerini]RDY31711.1 hypothetical protein CG710_008300 [Lachnotalea glycerini]
MKENQNTNINLASYIGKPISNTVMYISKKIESLIKNLEYVENCLIFCEDSIDIPSELFLKHVFIKTANPQLEYAKFVSKLSEDKEQRKRERKYALTDEGYYIGEDVLIGKNTTIEPGCFIDHDVIIGNNAKILSGTKIRNAIIGNNFIAGENAVIGSSGFIFTRDEKSNLLRIPTLGKVIIGDNVEIGAFSNISAGSAGNTIINNYVKIDVSIYIAHDVVLESNVEITAGVVIGGFTRVENDTYIGINATIRNRITIGENSLIGMGSVVTKSVPPNKTLIGNPAKYYKN